MVKDLIDPSGSVPPSPAIETLLLGASSMLTLLATGRWLGGVGVGTVGGVGVGTVGGVGVGAVGGVGVGAVGGVGVGTVGGVGAVGGVGVGAVGGVGGVGGVGVGAGAMLVTTVAPGSLPLLLPGFGSLVVEVLLAVLLTVPVAGTGNVTLRLTVTPSAKLAMGGKVTMPVAGS